MQGHNPFRESSTVMLLHPRVQHHRNRRGRRLRLAQPFHPHVQDPGGLTHPTGARRRVERTPFGNSGRPLTAPNSCLNNNFSCLNDKIGGRNFPVPVFLLILFSNSSVRSHASLQAKSPCCTFALRKRKGDVRPDLQKFPPPQKNHN